MILIDDLRLYAFYVTDNQYECFCDGHGQNDSPDTMDWNGLRV